jgi:glycosyltransferase involved in cell wall biosynthesis
MITRSEGSRVKMASEPQMMSRSWSINGRFLGRHLTGVDRYALEILRAMDKLVAEGHPLTIGLALEVLCPAGHEIANPFRYIPLRSLPSASGHIWEQLVLPYYLSDGLLSLCNTGPLLVKKQILCIHDANTRLVPESYGLPFRMAYRVLEPALGRRLADIVTVSQYSQKTLVEFNIARGKKITLIPDGHEHTLDWRPDRSSFVGVGLPSPFVLLVGSKAPHKNVSIIYSIAADLAVRGIHVLVTGGRDSNVYARERCEQALPNIKHLGRVTDDDLAYLYRNALCLAFPSITEGFGLPALEAMALGCPVIASDAASLAEVCDDAVLYASPYDPAAWLAAICEIADQPSLRKRLARSGPERSKAFSWRKGAEKYLELMSAADLATQKLRSMECPV